jgi:hypothetical protein
MDVYLMHKKYIYTVANPMLFIHEYRLLKIFMSYLKQVSFIVIYQKQIEQNILKNI